MNFNDNHKAEAAKDDSFDYIKQRGNNNGSANELNFKTAVRGFQKQEVIEYISELNKSFHTSQSMLTQRVTELHDELAVARREKENYSEKVKTLKAELATSKQDALIDAAPENYQKIINNLKAENATLFEDNKNLTAEYKANIAESKAVRDELVMAKSERDEAVKKLTKAETESSMFGAQLDTAQKQNDSLREELKNLTAGNNSLREQLSKSNEGAQRLEADLNATRKELAGETASVIELKAAIKTAAEQVQNLNSDVEELKAEKLKLSETVENLKQNQTTADFANSEEIEKLSKQLAKASEKNDMLKEQLKFASAEYESLKNQYDKELENSKELNQKLVNLANSQTTVAAQPDGAEVDLLKEEIADKDNTIKQLNATISSMLNQHESAADVEALKAENAALAERISQLLSQQQSVPAEGQIDVSLNQDYIQLKQENERLDQENQKYKLYFKRVKEELQSNASNANAEALQQAELKLKEAAAENASLKSSILMLNGQIKNLEAAANTQNSPSGETVSIYDYKTVVGERDSLLTEKVDLESKIHGMEIEIGRLSRSVNAPAPITASPNTVVVDKLKEINSQLLNKNDKMAAELDSLHKKNDELISRLTRAQDELYTLKKSVEEDLAYEEERRNIKNGILPKGAISEFDGDNEFDKNLSEVDRRLNKLLK